MLVISLVAVALIALVVIARFSKQGQPPGVADGRLTRCPDTPNCVCSEFRADRTHFIEPFELPAETAARALTRIRTAILEQGGSIRSESADYLAATYTTPLFGFVDDLEIRIDPANGLAHVRSASRVGHGDLGVNRKRVERLRELLRGGRDAGG